MMCVTDGSLGLVGRYEDIGPGDWPSGQSECTARGGHMFAYDTEVELHAITCKWFPFTFNTAHLFQTIKYARHG